MGTPVAIQQQGTARKNRSQLESLPSIAYGIAQNTALPPIDRNPLGTLPMNRRFLERATGFEPATKSLGSSYSTN